MDTTPLLMLCLCCGKQLPAADAHSASPLTPPSGATVFYSRGNYGSGAFDSVYGGQHLEAFVCDGCIIERAPRVWHVTTATDEYKVWDPQKETGQ